VIQNNVFNRSAIQTVIVCVLTSRLARAKHRGHIILETGEGGLTQRSAVNVSQVMTVDKIQLVERIGGLSQRRVREIIKGINRVLEPGEARGQSA